MMMRSFAWRPVLRVFNAPIAKRQLSNFLMRRKRTPPSTTVSQIGHGSNQRFWNEIKITLGTKIAGVGLIVATGFGVYWYIIYTIKRKTDELTSSIEEKLSSIKTATQEKFKSAKESTAAFYEKARGKLDSYSSSAKERGNQVLDETKEVISSVKSRTGETYERVKQTTKDRFQETKDKTTQSWKDLVDGVKNQANERKEKNKEDQAATITTSKSSEDNNQEKAPLDASQISNNVQNEGIGAKEISQEVVEVRKGQGTIESLQNKFKDHYQSFLSKIPILKSSTSASNSTEKKPEQSHNIPSSSPDSQKPPN